MLIERKLECLLNLYYYFNRGKELSLFVTASLLYYAGNYLTNYIIKANISYLQQDEVNFFCIIK